jgi:hypothetical protein
MSWLLFLDESGHDHRNMPYEVRGGVAIQDARLWPFVGAMQRLELDAFGCELHQFRKELKGSKLLDKDRFVWAAQASQQESSSRRKHARSFLTKGLEHKTPTRDEFTAYGQACLEMTRGIYQLLRDHGAVLFATAIPRKVPKPTTPRIEEFLRKDHVFLFERFFYFLESRREHGLLVMDEVEKNADRRFLKQIEAYFSKTAAGRYRTQWIVPAPFFVSSDLTYPIQAADLCIYCINWGFRLPSVAMDAPKRDEIGDEFGPWLRRLQYHGEGSRDGHVFESWGITYVPNPYSPGRDPGP